MSKNTKNRLMSMGLLVASSTCFMLASQNPASADDQTEPKQAVVVTNNQQQTDTQNTNESVTVPTADQSSESDNATQTESDSPQTADSSAESATPTVSEPDSENSSATAEPATTTDSTTTTDAATKTDTTVSDSTDQPTSADSTPTTETSTTDNSEPGTAVTTTGEVSAQADTTASGVQAIPNAQTDQNKDGNSYTDLTVDNVNNSTDPALHPKGGLIYNAITDVTSFAAASVLYPLFASKFGSQLTSKFRTLLSPDRYDIDQTWKYLSSEYDSTATKEFYTAAKTWWETEAPKQDLAIPFADGSGTARGTYVAKKGSNKTVIYGQGWTTEPSWMGYISKVFYDMGYNVLMVYTEGQSSSDGNFINFGAKDKNDWVNWVNRVNEINGKDGEVILYGQSLGADLALEAAGTNEMPSNVKAVIADCGYSTIPSLLYSQYSGIGQKFDDLASKFGIKNNGNIPFLPFNKLLNSLNFWQKTFTGTSFDEASGLTAVQNSKLPTLFISTKDDTFIPDNQTETLYNLSASENKQLWILGGTVGGHASANNDVVDYMAHIEQFLKTVDSQNQNTDIKDKVLSV
ncbi:alpha/beta hydrolase [Lentilactobacillus curieae]|uniref:Alpha/beta hydrolase n=1 Tax=Lentilactobacillus curieae TaxID=1138822 RepID=A0A1S6QIQ3_9LACO|nr:alpha/beta hydrolase [Lentilactobacillus curieae]AQW21479.1 alpha/beta hydrolase [Lentilactobacillus curieae]